MADLNVERRYGGTRMTWGWIGLAILLLAVIAWIVYSFTGIASDPDPVPVDFERAAPASGTADGAGAAPAPQAGQQPAPGGQ